MNDILNDNHAVEREILGMGGVPEGYTPIEVEFFQFKTPGEKLEGRLINKSIISVRNGRVGKYTLQRHEDGQPKKTAFLGSIQLDELMSNATIGSEIYVMYIAEEAIENSSFKMKRFK